MHKQRLPRRLRRHGYRARFHKGQSLRLARQLGRLTNRVLSARTRTVEIRAGVDCGPGLEGGVGRGGDYGAGHVETGDERVEL
jgi:hypothetical protein